VYLRIEKNKQTMLNKLILKKNKLKKQLTLLILFCFLISPLITNAAFIEPSASPANSDQDFTQNIMGANSNNNDFDSSTVVSNQDGSLIERLQYIAEAIASLWTKTGSDLSYTSGNIGIGTTTPQYGQLEVKPTAGDSTTGITLNDGTNATARSWIGTGDLWHLTRGSVATNGLTIDTGGNVGIGTTTPAYDLDVYGNGRFDGNLTVSGTTNLGTIATGLWNGTAIDFSSYTNATAGTGITFTDDAISVTDNYLLNNANDTTTGTITSAGLIVGDGQTVGATTNKWLFDDTNNDVTTTGNVGIGTV